MFYIKFLKEKLNSYYKELLISLPLHFMNEFNTFIYQS